MKFQIEQYSGRDVAGFHMVGPWEDTVHQGFERLSVWLKAHNVHSGEWLAIYYDNPEETPAEKLRCDTVVSVAKEYVIPPGSEGIIKTRIAEGTYAVARAKVDDGDFGKPWMSFFAALGQEGNYIPVAKPCFEHYLNDGSESGVWEFDMYIPVEA